MPSTLEALVWPDLSALVTTTWTEVSGLYRLDLLDRLSLRAQLNQASLAMPMAAASLGVSKPQDWGIDNEAYRLAITVFYGVRRDDSRGAIPGGFDALTLILNRLIALREALIAHEGAFQCAGEHPVINVGEEMTLNHIAREQNLPILWGSIEVNALVGQSFTS